MFRLSIISPIYNVEKYLNEFLDSLKKQTLQSNEFEIILVDDGSTDSSFEYARKFQSENTNVKLYSFDKPSGAAGRARNKGLDLAEGKYIMFLDPDDVLPEYSIKALLGFIEQTNSCFVGSQFAKKCNERISLYPSFINKNNRVFHDISGTDSFFLKLPPSVWSKIYNLEFLRKNKIRFMENVIAQDFAFNFECAIAATKASFLPIVTVYYRIRSYEDKSVTNNVNAKYFKDLLAVRKYCSNISVEKYIPLIESDVKFAISQFSKASLKNYLVVRKAYLSYLQFLFNLSKEQGFVFSRRIKIFYWSFISDLFFLFVKAKIVKGKLKRIFHA